MIFMDLEKIYNNRNIPKQIYSDTGRIRTCPSACETGSHKRL